MVQRYRLFAAACAIAAAQPAVAGVATFAFVNSTGSDISGMEARKSGTANWASVPYSAAAGASGAASFDNEDCAWDLKVKMASGSSLTFSNVNLCEARLVTLHQKNGVVWVDYD